MAAKRLGILSDTHGLLREEVVGRLRGCDMVLHAGDIGSPSILTELRMIAEVVVVRGNVDTGSWAQELSLEESVDVDGHRICLVHDLSTLSLDPASAGVDIVVYGHSHKPSVEWKGHLLYLNPGSAGPKRFHVPVSMAFLRLAPDAVIPELVEL